jgi:hypothetical protein
VLRHFHTKWLPNRRTGCWLWVGYVERDGYGRLFDKTYSGRVAQAHRYSYEKLVGPIPPGMRVLHDCEHLHRNPVGSRRCVNPAHLKLGTDRDNMADRDAKGRQARGERNLGAGGAKLSERAVQEILESRWPARFLAGKYGVDTATIRRVRLRKGWTHVKRR